MARVLIVGGYAPSLTNFRGPLLQEMKAAGHMVIAAAGEPNAEVVKKLSNWGILFKPLPLDRTGMSVVRDICTIIAILRLICRYKPEVILSYTIKPVVYGGLVARFYGVGRRFALISGLGYAFVKSDTYRQRVAGWIASRLYKVSLCGYQNVFFQNPDDLNEFVTLGFVSRTQSILLNGSGVDLLHYRVALPPSKPVFLMIARLLADKGVREYVDAARISHKLPVSDSRSVESRLRFILVGAPDSNPTSVTKNELHSWVREGVVEYRGCLEDVRPVMEECAVYVLPSYREGLPRTVLEAMAAGRPIITTDTPGCRETIVLTDRGREQRARGEPVMEGENGYLVRPRDASALASAMRQLIIYPELIPLMGNQSLRIAKERFDVKNVNAVMMTTMSLI